MVSDRSDPMTMCVCKGANINMHRSHAASFLVLKSCVQMSVTADTDSGQIMKERVMKDLGWLAALLEVPGVEGSTGVGPRRASLPRPPRAAKTVSPRHRGTTVEEEAAIIAFITRHRLGGAVAPLRREGGLPVTWREQPTASSSSLRPARPFPELSNELWLGWGITSLLRRWSDRWIRLMCQHFAYDVRLI